MDNFIVVITLIASFILTINQFRILRKNIKDLGIHIKRFTPKYLYETLPEFIVMDLEIALYFFVAFIVSLLLYVITVK